MEIHTFNERLTLIKIHSNIDKELKNILHGLNVKYNDSLDVWLIQTSSVPLLNKMMVENKNKENKEKV